jgi:hypothetical protein
VVSRRVVALAFALGAAAYAEALRFHAEALQAARVAGATFMAIVAWGLVRSR